MTCGFGKMTHESFVDNFVENEDFYRKIKEKSTSKERFLKKSVIFHTKNNRKSQKCCG